MQPDRQKEKLAGVGCGELKGLSEPGESCASLVSLEPSGGLLVAPVPRMLMPLHFCKHMQLVLRRIAEALWSDHVQELQNGLKLGHQPRRPTLSKELFSVAQGWPGQGLTAQG